MATPNGLTSRFNRTYIYLNPEVFTGPYTQRLSNFAPTDTGETVEIENLYGIPPIVSTESLTTAHLTFNIDAIDRNVWSSKTSSLRLDELAKNVIDYAPYKSEHGIRNISRVTSTAPVSSNQIDADAVVWFDINQLPGIDTVRATRKMKVLLNLPYNSRSITAITASAPLEVATAGSIANVSFDITSLPPA